MQKQNSNGPTVRVNFILEGEQAAFLIEEKRRGRISTFREGISRGITLFEKEELEMQMSKARVSAQKQM